MLPDDVPLTVLPWHINDERFAVKIAEETGGGVLVISEGVFGMRGEQGKLKEICALKEKYNFRLLVDDAHGFGTLGKTGAGAGEEQGVQDAIDVYFATFAKSMAGIGAFFAGDKEVIKYLQYNMRSQMFAKSLPMSMVKGALKRLDMIRTIWVRIRLLLPVRHTRQCRCAVHPITAKG